MKQERPSWCPHADCAFIRLTDNVACVGKLPIPILHDGVPNTHRLCLKGAADDGGVFDLQINTNDIEHTRWLFDAIDGKKTSWLSGYPAPPEVTPEEKETRG